MSIRAAAHFVMQNGRLLVRSIRNNNEFRCISNYSNGQINKIHVVQLGKPQVKQPQANRPNSVPGKHLSYLGAQARRLFVDNVLKRVTNTLASDLSRRAARQLLFGNSQPFFALVGVSLASGTGILTKEDELEGVCWEIRKAVHRVQWNKPRNDRNYETMGLAGDLPDRRIGLKDFVIGPLLAKGSSAVVYATRFKTASERENCPEPAIADAEDSSAYPLAIKMMFNYHAESNAMSILKAMHRETVPARERFRNEELGEWEQRMAKDVKTLPPHPNVVAMYSVFADTVPALPESLRVFPDALPARLNPTGSGRNMSLFLLMKRYDITLKNFLENKEINIRESVLLFAQLLEGIAHVNFHAVAHRDLKSDNILLDLTEESDNCPSLVITDFGCCLADKSHGLYLPYNSHDVDKGGNAALMAPEVINAEPGSFASIDYTKSDLWTAGTIAYEIFGMKNPFYGEEKKKVSSGGSGPKNYDYSENDLPSLPDSVPSIVSALVRNILSQNLYKRLSAQMAATVVQLHLWAPNSWFQKDGKIPPSNEIMQWLLCLTTKVLCEGRAVELNISESTFASEEPTRKRQLFQRSLSTSSCGRRTMPEYQLIASFLSRVSLGSVRDGLEWIQANGNN